MLYAETGKYLLSIVVKFRVVFRCTCRSGLHVCWFI